MTRRFFQWLVVIACLTATARAQATDPLITALSSFEPGADQKAMGLIAAGAHVDATNQEGDTALHKASLHGYVEIVRALLDHGAAVNARNKANNTPLHIAAMACKTPVAKLLIERGADVTAKNGERDTPAEEAQKLGCVSATQLFRAASETASSGFTQLELLMGKFKGHSDDENLRREIITVALGLKPSPAVPPESQDAESLARHILSTAKSEDDYASATKEYLRAIELAPWVASYYYNTCLILERTVFSAQAAHACRLYLLASPDANDASEVRRHLIGLESARPQAHYLYPLTSDLNAYDAGGIWDLVAGRRIAIKLVAHWHASPPKYQVLISCANPNLVGSSFVIYDLETVEQSVDVCRMATPLRIVVNALGDGFVEVGAGRRDAMRTTITDLFKHLRESLDMWVVVSATETLPVTQRPRFFVGYVQPGSSNPNKNWATPGVALFASNCRGDLTRSNERGLPDAFIDGENVGDSQSRFLSRDRSPLTVAGVRYVFGGSACDELFQTLTGYAWKVR